MKVGTYEVRGELGRGGNAVVYRGLAPDGHEVAIKVLKRTASGDAHARFSRERRLSKQLGEAGGFVPVLESGESEQGSFIIMPLLPGGTLRQRLERGPLPIADAVHLVRTLAGALARAHGLGIVHRDLKPENVLFNRSGQPLVADLGLGKHVRADTPGASQSIALTRDGQFSGTAGYMAPEQIEGVRDAGPPADVFALGAILYECVAGRPAFEAPSLFELLARASEGRFTPLGTARPGAPRWLEAAVARALDPDPAARFPEAASFAAALTGETGEVPVRSRRALVLGLAALGTLGVLALVIGVLAVRRLRSPDRVVREPIETWEQGVAALAAGESDPERRATARGLIDEATRAGSARLDTVLRALERGLESAPLSSDLRRGHARARARLELEAPVVTSDLAALAGDADQPELEMLARQAVAAGTSGTQTLETARALSHAHPSSRALVGLVAIAAFHSQDPGARREGIAAIESAHASAGHLRALRDACLIADRAAEVLAAADTAPVADLESSGRALLLEATQLGSDPVLAAAAPVILAPLAPGARSAARSIRVGFSGARERRVAFGTFARVAHASHCSGPPELLGALELDDPDDVPKMTEIGAAHDRRIALAARLEASDPAMSFALVESAATRMKPFYRDEALRPKVFATLDRLDVTCARAEALLATRPRDEPESLWIAAIAKGCCSRGSFALRALEDADPKSSSASAWLERALVLDRHALTLVRAHRQFGVEIGQVAEDVVEDLLRLDRTDGFDEAAETLEPFCTMLAEIRRRSGHDPSGAERQLRGIVTGPTIRARPLAEPIFALCAADLGHFDEARAHLRAAVAEEARGTDSWGPFRSDRLLAYIEAAERKAAGH